MTDRLKGFIVTLETDLREDAAEHTLTALRMVKGVASVKPLVSEHADFMAQERVKREVREKLWEWMRKELGT